MGPSTTALKDWARVCRGIEREDMVTHAFPQKWGDGVKDEITHALRQECGPLGHWKSRPQRYWGWLGYRMWGGREVWREGVH